MHFDTKQDTRPYNADHPAEAEPEPVWTYRGYRLRSSDFTTAMVHFFRAEIQRANVWRQRLDTTTNWAVVTTGAAITLVFNDAGHHAVIILNIILVTLFLFIEARRYRYYELWSYRVRLMETDFYATMLVPPFQPSMDWAESLAENLLHPNFPISMWEAFGRRLRRNYLWIYIILGIAWVVKIWLQSSQAASWSEVVQYAAIGNIPGWMVASGGLLLYSVLLLVSLLTQRLHNATGEVLPRFGSLHNGVSAGNGSSSQAEHARAWFRNSRRRQQLLALIITDQAKEVSDKILNEMKRGVTALSGTGMYTGQPHSMLVCALTVTEVSHLKRLVSDVDAKAFMIVSPAHEVLGQGFGPLKTET
jgi:uncharacterized membrane protein